MSKESSTDFRIRIFIGQINLSAAFSLGIVLHLSCSESSTLTIVRDPVPVVTISDRNSPSCDASIVQQTVDELRNRRIEYEEGPKYPKWAQKNGIEADLLVRLVVSREGTIRHAELLGGDRRFLPEVIDTIRTWKLSPLLINGVAVETCTDYRFKFVLD